MDQHITKEWLEQQFATKEWVAEQFSGSTSRLDTVS
jgi:hypothetical protein